MLQTKIKQKTPKRKEQVTNAFYNKGSKSIKRMNEERKKDIF